MRKKKEKERKGKKIYTNKCLFVLLSGSEVLKKKRNTNAIIKMTFLGDHANIIKCSDLVFIIVIMIF